MLPKYIFLLLLFLLISPSCVFCGGHGYSSSLGDSEDGSIENEVLLEPEVRQEEDEADGGRGGGGGEEEEQDEITDPLPGLNFELNFKHYSGL
jgi:hypothetical protein